MHSTRLTHACLAELFHSQGHSSQIRNGQAVQPVIISYHTAHAGLQIQSPSFNCMLLQDGTLRPMALCLGNAETPGGSLGPPLGGDVFTCLAFPQGPSAGLQGQNHLYVGAASGAVYQVRVGWCTDVMCAVVCS